MGDGGSYDREMRVYQGQVDELFKSSPDLVTVPRAELEAIRNAIGEVVGAMLEGGDGETGDFGWNISKLTKARPAIRDGLAKLEAHLKAHGGNDAE